jgi:hypothetical protein
MLWVFLLEIRLFDNAAQTQVALSLLAVLSLVRNAEHYVPHLARGIDHIA